MALKYPFIILVYIVIIFAILIAFKKNQNQQSKTIKGSIARIDDIKSTNIYKKIEKRNATIKIINFISFMMLIGGLVIVSARPMITSKQPKENYGLDIMIVLDTSGSMTDYFKQVGKSINDLVKKFESDRLGMIVFSGEAQTALPLTDDYTEIKIMADFLENKHYQDFRYNYAYSVRGGTDISSGLFLASAKMDYVDKNRTKAIVLVSDGQQTTSTEDDPDGKQPIDKDSVRKAATMLSNKNVKIYAIATPGEYPYDGKELLEDITKTTKGETYSVNDVQATSEIFNKIDSQLRSNIKTDTIMVRHDNPMPWLLFSLFALACFLISASLLINGGLV